VAEVLRDAALAPELIELEITENTVTSDPGRADVVLGKLKQLGVRISVDDFGTGYSSLAHLRSLPLDTVKIDRSFVKDLCSNHGDQVIVRCIIDLATNLDLVVVAEGVEDARTLALLREMGCEKAQGYYLGMPSTVAEIEQQLVARELLTDLIDVNEVHP
jgi:EAL domain-containing protein (putative c-di-GMP-specific phosphodiesterase class I)